MTGEELAQEDCVHSPDLEESRGGDGAHGVVLLGHLTFVFVVHAKWLDVGPISRVDIVARHVEGEFDFGSCT